MYWRINIFLGADAATQSKTRALYGQLLCLFPVTAYICVCCSDTNSHTESTYFVTMFWFSILIKK